MSAFGLTPPPPLGADVLNEWSLSFEGFDLANTYNCSGDRLTIEEVNSDRGVCDD